jgi:hypothetical protein
MISPPDRASAGATAMIVHLGEYLARRQRAVREGSERLDVLLVELKRGK